MGTTARAGFGQVIGKGVPYWIARRAPSPGTGRLGQAGERWRATCDRCPRSAGVVVFMNAVFGLPPLSITSVAAGALRITFAGFASVATIRRLFNFGAIAGAGPAASVVRN